MDGLTSKRGPRRIRRALVAFALATTGGLAAAWALVPESRTIPATLLARATAPVEAPADAVRPRGLRVQVVRLAPLTEERSFTGTVVARYEAPLSFRIAGRVLARHIEVGQSVSTGEPLFDLDPADYKLALGLPRRRWQRPRRRRARRRRKR
jgi:multidrug efflux pump subunit AcrA (membrane-fusion protein)